jgi:hypothetical protein
VMHNASYQSKLLVIHCLVFKDRLCYSVSFSKLPTSFIHLSFLFPFDDLISIPFHLFDVNTFLMFFSIKLI